MSTNAIFPLRVDSAAAQGQCSQTRDYREEVLTYWEETTGLYLQHGTTFQGGFVFAPGEPATSRANNLLLASRAGIQPGHCVLDAGCGVCGPSIDIAQNIKAVRIDAVTLSPSQAKVSRDAIIEAGLVDRIHIHVCDYHHLTFEDERFDVVFFFESMYSLDLPQLLAGIYRVLRPGGRLYAKEVFRKEQPLSLLEQEAISEFEDLFRYKLRLMSDAAEGIAAAGFERIESRDLSPLVSTQHYDRAMVEFVFGFPLLTEFGRRHHRQFNSVPVLFGELRARKPFCRTPRAGSV
jgi:ubiquinone/menaquinone biosynthesis C-methylase UbiE